MIQRFVGLVRKFHVWRLIILPVLGLLLLLGVTARHVLAAGSYMVSGVVTDQSSTPIQGATVTATDTSTTPNTSYPTTTNMYGQYTLTLPGGDTYNFEVTPPSTLGLDSAESLDQSITPAEMLNFVLVPMGSPITVLGEIIDEATGLGVPNMNVSLSPSSGGPVTAEDQSTSSGYTLQVPAGNYVMSFNPMGPSSLAGGYTYTTGNCTLPLTGTTTLPNIVVPFQPISVQVQDTTGMGVQGAFVSVNGTPSATIPLDGCSLSTGSMSLNASSSTDQNGMLSMEAPAGTFNFSVSPPMGSGYLPFTSTSIVIVGSQKEVFVLEPTPPTVGQVIVPTSPVRVGTVVTASASFTDPVQTLTHTAVWNWGDGSTSAGTVTESNGSGTVTGQHTYTSIGAFIPSVSITNSRGASGSSQAIVTISPIGGFAGANLKGVNYSGGNLSGQNLAGSNLQEAVFASTDLQSASLKGVNLQSASLQQANLGSANLSGANLQKVNLSGANLNGANLSGTNLQKVDLNSANLSGANLKGANLQGAMITGVIWASTTCPDGTNSDNDGGTCARHGGGL